MSGNDRSSHQNIPGSKEREENTNNNQVPPSPPVFLSLEELMKAARDVANMRIAHEIALNNDFKIERPELPAESVEAVVRSTLQRAFWDLLTEELASSPPRFNQALRLMSECKEGLLDLLLPQHSALRQQIVEVLDEQLIRQQAEQGTINFQEYADFVLSVMSRMCAPVRDEEIAKLRTVKEVVPLFRGLMETLEHMKVDMANFAIEYLRPHLSSETTVQYEREKFKKFLALKEGDKTAYGWVPFKEWPPPAFECFKL